jgi:hypothetical protein
MPALKVRFSADFHDRCRCRNISESEMNALKAEPYPVTAEGIILRLGGEGDDG